MNTIRRSRFLSCGLLVSALFAWSCGEKTTGPDDSSATGPKVGNTYEIDVYQLNSLGQQLPGIVNEGTIRVTANNETYRGKTGVVTYVRQKDNRITYMHTNEAGDISFYSSGYGVPFGPVSAPMWVEYPVGTKGESSTTLVDSTFVSALGESERLIVKRDVKYLGEETKSVEGKSYTTHKVWERITMEMLDETGESTSAQRVEGTFWYSPELHYFMQYDAKSWIGDLDNPSLFTASRDILVKYTEP